MDSENDKTSRNQRGFAVDRRGNVEPMTGIEPAPPAWEAGVLPLNYIGKNVAVSWQLSNESHSIIKSPPCNLEKTP